MSNRNLAFFGAATYALYIITSSLLKGYPAAILGLFFWILISSFIILAIRRLIDKERIVSVALGTSFIFGIFLGAFKSFPIVSQYFFEYNQYCNLY